jgi:hypothetical protein
MMNKELKQRAQESADRLTRAGMTLSAGVLLELVAEAERLQDESTASAEYIRFLETELIQAQMEGPAVLEQTQVLSEQLPQARELRLNQMVLAGEMNN